MSRKPRRSLTAGIDFSTDEGKSLLELAADSDGDEDEVAAAARSLSPAAAGAADEPAAMRRQVSADSENSDSTSDTSDRSKRRSSAESDASAQSQPHNPGVQPQQRRPRRRSAADVGPGGSAADSAAAGAAGPGGSRTVQSRREYHNKAERERTKKINGLIQVRAASSPSARVFIPRTAFSAKSALLSSTRCRLLSVVLRSCGSFSAAQSRTRRPSYPVL